MHVCYNRFAASNLQKMRSANKEYWRKTVMSLPGYRHFLRLVLLIACSLILTVVLAACGGGTTASKPTPTPKPSPSPSPTATQTPRPAVGTTTYKGNGFTLTYTQGWKVTSTSSGVEFSDPTNAFHFIVVVAPNTSGVSASTLLSAEIQAIDSTLKNVKVVEGPTQTSLAGDTAEQEEIEGTDTTSSPSITTDIQFISDNHPNNKTPTTNFTIFYGAAASQMHAATTDYFQQMLDSFAFTS
jgi:hypothetical protein